MLNHLAGNAATAGPITQASLHTAYPPSDANELSGGSPAYARKALTFEAAAGTESAGSLDVTNQPVFDIPPATTVSSVAYRAADGTILADADLTDEAFVLQGTYTLTDTDLHLNS